MVDSKFSMLSPQLKEENEKLRRELRESNQTVDKEKKRWHESAKKYLLVDVKRHWEGKVSFPKINNNLE